MGQKKTEELNLELTKERKKPPSKKNERKKETKKARAVLLQNVILINDGKGALGMVLIERQVFLQPGCQQIKPSAKLIGHDRVVMTGFGRIIIEVFPIP